MDINRLTEKAQEAVQATQSAALRRSSQQADIEHLLVAPLSSAQSLCRPGLRHASYKLFTEAEDEAKRIKDDFISVGHFLLAASDDSKAFQEVGITRDRITQALREVRGNQRITTKNPEATYEALEEYGRDPQEGCR